jgi:curli biogenesis system outer membrane secretion channel CsgG
MKMIQWFVISAFVLVLTTQMGMSQGKTSFDAEKTKIAILPFEAAKIAEQYGFKGTISWGKSNVTYEEKPDSPFSSVEAIIAFAEAATQRAVDAFVATKRFTVLDRTAMEKIMKEQNFQLTDNVDQNSVVNIGVLLGAQYIVNGQVQSVSTNPVYDKKNTSKLLGYSGTVEIQITLIDVATGQVTSSKRLKGSTEVEGSKVFGVALLDVYESTPAKAAYKGLSEITSDMKKWLREAFPVIGDVYEILKEKKGAAEKVSITCGKDIGTKKDDKFKVYEEKQVEVNGKTINKTTDVGSLVVSKVEEDGVFSTCSVEKGGKAISEKIKAGVKLKVVSVKK